MPDLIAPSATEAPAASPIPQAPAESETLSDHEAQFGPGAQQASTADADDDAPASASTDDRDERGQFKPKRHRAQSQKATPADVPRINALTKQLREAQEQLERFRSAPQTAPAAEQARTEARTDAPKPVERPTQPDRFPSFDTWSAKPENAALDFDDYIDARADHRASMLWQKQVDTARQQYEQQQRTQAEQAVSGIEAEIIKDFGARAQAFIAQTPDFQQVIAPIMNFDLTPLLKQVILEDDNGPKIAYALGSNPDLFHEIMFQTDGKPVSEQSVAILRRRLASLTNTRTQAAATGSAAAPEPRYIAPRPPNPVRTGPMKTGDDLPGDESSLAEHEKAFGSKRRR